MKKTLITLLAFLFTVTIVYAQQATVFHPLNGDRKVVEVGDSQAFVGGYELETPYNFYEQSLGGATGSVAFPLIVANFESSLATKISSTDTSMTLVSGTDDDGNALNGYYGFTIDVGSASQEYVVATCAGTTCTSMQRGISVSTGTTTVAALQKSHRRGASVQITDHPNLAIITNILNGLQSVPDRLYYSNTVSIGAGDNNKSIITKEYADALVASGVATSTESVFGGNTLSTQLEMASSTYSVNDPKVLYSRYATSSPDVRGIYVPISENDGYLNQGWIDYSENVTTSGDWTFSGENTFSATTTMATTTIAGDLTVGSSTSIFSGTVIGAGFNRIAVYTSSGTWTKPDGVTKIKVQVVGGGGGGGSISSTVSGTGGGGGGGYSMEIIDVTATTSVDYVVGAGGSAGADGGASSFGQYLSAAGGSDGEDGQSGDGGSGGIGADGDLNFAGNGGGAGVAGSSATSNIAGAGGGSFFGGGAKGIAKTNSAANGSAAQVYGGGGGGCVTVGGSDSCTGGAGAAGVVIIEY